MVDLNWFGWILIVFFILQIVVSIFLIGKERKPLDPGAALLTFVMSMLFITGIFFVGVN